MPIPKDPNLVGYTTQQKQNLMCPHIKITLRAEIRWNHVASRAFPLRGLGDPILGRSCEDHSACKAAIRKTQPLAGKLWRVDMMPGAGATPELHHLAVPICCQWLHSLTCLLQPAMVGLCAAFQKRGCKCLLETTHTCFSSPYSHFWLYTSVANSCRNGDTSCSLLGQVYCVSSGMALPPKN